MFTHHLSFRILDEGYPRGKTASAIINGEEIVLTAEYDEEIERVIDDWWLAHGEDAVARSGDEADGTLYALNAGLDVPASEGVAA